MTCVTCGKQAHLLGFDYGHEYSEDEDFITSTIRDVDEMLRGERIEQTRAVSVGASADEWDTASMAEYAEWSREVDEELWDRLCAVHGDERDEDGLCPQCRQEIAEERRNDL